MRTRLRYESTHCTSSTCMSSHMNVTNRRARNVFHSLDIPQASSTSDGASCRPLALPASEVAFASYHPGPVVRAADDAAVAVGGGCAWPPQAGQRAALGVVGIAGQAPGLV
jgi:hypothetical protein